MTTPIPFDDFGGEGPTLHFAHANGYPPACYRRLIEPLTNQYHVLAVHHRPLWPGAAPEDMSSWYEIGQDMIQFMDENGLSNSIGVGHSLGAVATMYAAIERPDLFRAVVLMEPVLMMPAILQLFATKPIEELTEEYPLLKISKSRRNSWKSREEAFEHYRPKRVFAKWSDDTLWDYIWHGLQRNREGQIELIYAPEWEARIYALPPTDIWDLIPKLEHPTFGIRGAETDTLVPAAWQLWQMAQPKGKFVNLADCTHLLPMEKPVEIAEHIHNFLVDLDA